MPKRPCHMLSCNRNASFRVIMVEIREVTGPEVVTVNACGVHAIVKATSFMASMKPGESATILHNQ